MSLRTKVRNRYGKGKFMKSIYPKLSGKIREVCGTQCKFADMMGLSNQQITRLVGGKTYWNQKYILTACDILNIDIEDIPAYFFKSDAH